jgi:hypothetical protein
VCGPWPKSFGPIIVEEMVNVVFYIDLVLSFFIPYTNQDGVPVKKLLTIMLKYLSCMFWLNLFACMPVELIEYVMGLGEGSDQDSSTTRAVRVVRLQRLFRLLRLFGTSVRLGRMFYIFRSSRWVKAALQFAFFAVSVNLFACIWDYRVVLMTFQYSACFGGELVMNNVPSSHFHDYFGVGLSAAGALAMVFGAMNLFARSVGGIASDWANVRWEMQGRLWVHFFLLFGQALLHVLRRGGPARVRRGGDPHGARGQGRGLDRGAHALDARLDAPGFAHGLRGRVADRRPPEPEGDADLGAQSMGPARARLRSHADVHTGNVRVLEDGRVGFN